MKDQATIAAVSTFPVKPGKLDELVQLLQDLVPTTLPGLQQVLFLVDREKHEVKSIAYYETEAAAKAMKAGSAQVANQEIVARMAKLVTGQGDRNLYEIAAVWVQANSSQAAATS